MLAVMVTQHTVMQHSFLAMAMTIADTNWTSNTAELIVNIVRDRSLTLTQFCVHSKTALFCRACGTLAWHQCDRLGCKGWM